MRGVEAVMAGIEEDEEVAGLEEVAVDVRRWVLPAPPRPVRTYDEGIVRCVCACV